MYEQNRRSPGKDMLLKIAKVFNVSVDYLLSSDTYNTTSTKENHNYKDVNDILKTAKEQLMNTEALLFNGERGTCTTGIRERCSYEFCQAILWQFTIYS